MTRNYLESPHAWMTPEALNRLAAAVAVMVAAPVIGAGLSLASCRPPPPELVAATVATAQPHERN